MGILKDGKADENQAICMQVSFDKKLPHGTSGYLSISGLWLGSLCTQSTVDAQGRRILMAWLRMPQPVDGKWQGMMSIPRVVEVKNGKIYFRVHPNIQNVYTKKIDSPKEASDAGYRLRFSLQDGEEVNVGGYRIFRQGKKSAQTEVRCIRHFPSFVQSLQHRN